MPGGSVGDDFLRALLRGAFALVFVEDFLAQTEVFWRGFDVFVRADVFQGAFEGKFQRRVELDALAVALGAHVGQLFRFAGIDRDVVVARILPDDHSFVNPVARLDHEPAALLNHVERIGHGFAVSHAAHRPVLAGRNRAAIGPVFVEEMTHHAEPAGRVHEVRLEPDQAAHRDERLDADLLAVMIHVRDLGLAIRQVFQHDAHVVLGDFQKQLFNRFLQTAVLVLAVYDLGARDQHLVAFASHLLDQNGDLHFATAADGEDLRIAGLLNPQGDVGPDFLDQALPEVAGGDEFAVTAAERAVVYGEFHLDRWRVDRLVRQRWTLGTINDGFADEDLLEAGHADNVAGVSFLHFDTLQAFEVVNHRDLAVDLGAVAMNANGGLA